MSLLNNYILDYKLINEYSFDILEKYAVIPIKRDEIYTKFAVCSSDNDSFSYKKDNEIVKTIDAKKEDILFCLNDFDKKLLLYELAQNAISKKDDKFYVEEFFEIFLEYAISKNCSDIHLETSETSLIIRFRIDGVLKTFFSFSKVFYPILYSIIKLLSRLDITEKRKPQNGRLSTLVQKGKVDLRVSTMPIITGESIVIRILEQFNNKKNLNELGFDNKSLKTILKNIRKNNGLILVTGPTGSGKTTTLYSILNELNTNNKKIITIEDPIEYQIKGIQQIAVNSDIGLSFNDVLKNVLRQDPDIIMIGEIRDKESLSIALQASLTGHLVLSTLHTNDSISTLNRLFDLDAKPFLVASTLRAIISQRLVLKLCECSLKGCEECNYTKFKGRLSITEILEVDERVSSMISRQEDNNKILKYLKKNGFKSILEDAKEKVSEGLTTIDEVYKVVY